MRKKGAGWRGGWTFLAVKTQMKEHITGSHILCERDRERERKSEIMHERGKVRVKEKPVNHLKRLWGWHLHVHLLTLNIPRLSQSQWISLFSCDVLFDFVVFVRKNALLWFTHCKGFDRPGGKTRQKKLEFLTWKGQADTGFHFTSDHLFSDFLDDHFSTMTWPRWEPNIVIGFLHYT